MRLRLNSLCSMQPQSHSSLMFDFTYTESVCSLANSRFGSFYEMLQWFDLQQNKNVNFVFFMPCVPNPDNREIKYSALSQSAAWQGWEWEMQYVVLKKTPPNMILISFWARHTKRTQKWTMAALTLDLNFPFDDLVQVDGGFDIQMVPVLVPLLFPTVLMQMCFVSFFSWHSWPAGEP